MLAILFVFLFSKMIITYFSTFYSFLFNYLNRKMGSKNNEIKLTKFQREFYEPKPYLLVFFNLEILKDLTMKNFLQQEYQKQLLQLILQIIVI